MGAPMPPLPPPLPALQGMPQKSAGYTHFTQDAPVYADKAGHMQPNPTTSLVINRPMPTADEHGYGYGSVQQRPGLKQTQHRV